MLCQELVDYLAQKLVGHERRVLVVGDDDSADAFGPSVSVECVVCSSVFAPAAVTGLRTLLFDVLSLPSLCPFGDSLGEERHEFAITTFVRQ